MKTVNDDRLPLTDRALAYEEAFREVDSVLAEEGGEGLDEIAIMATVNSVLVQRFDYFFWTGFYRVRGKTLVVGPYIGTLGCLLIPFGKGVCGTAAASAETLVVPDVHDFPGHIACDARSRSEIVVPVFNGKKSLIAVLDVDSDRVAAFDEVDRRGLEKICTLFGRF